MDLNKFTQKAQEAVLGAQRLAAEQSHSQIEPEHLLFSLLRQPDGVVPEVVERIGVRPSSVTSQLEGTLASLPRLQAPASQPGLAQETTQALARAETEAGRLKDAYVSTENVLLALS